MNSKLKAAFIVSCIGICLTVASVIAFLISDCRDWVSGFSITSTGISIALGLFSIVYTYISGQQTLENLNKIEIQYNALVEKINYELSLNNSNEANIANVRNAIEEMAQK